MTVAVDHMNITVRRGEIFGLLGANGSGKSTLIRLISTLLILDGGEIRVFGNDVHNDERVVRRMINRVSVEASFFKKLSALENLMYAARLYDLPVGAARDLHPWQAGHGRETPVRAAGKHVARHAAEDRDRARAADLAGAAAARRADYRPRPTLEAGCPAFHPAHAPRARHDRVPDHPRH